MPIEYVFMIVFATFALGFLIGRGSGSGSPQGISRQAALRAVEAVPDDLDHRVQSLLKQGKKIEALKEMRRYTDKSLKEVKDIVDSMSAGTHQIAVENGSFSVVPVTNNSASEDYMIRVKELLKFGKKIEAIKHYREATGLGLKEAKDAVDRMDRDLR